MRNGITFLALAVLLALAGAVAQAPVEPDAAAAAKGKVIYMRYCASCHGPGARGNGPLAADLRVAPTDLTQLAAKKGGRFPFEDVVKTIDGRQTTRGHGSADMPVWGEVFAKTEGTDAPSVESALGRIAHYLWSIQGSGKK